VDDPDAGSRKDVANHVNGRDKRNPPERPYLNANRTLPEEIRKVYDAEHLSLFISAE
jgi:hypothetical protein